VELDVPAVAGTTALTLPATSGTVATQAFVTADYLPIAGGKVLQIVRATDATARSTTSTSFVDASISVTITPQKSTSAIIIIWNVFVYRNTGGEYVYLAISDASNVLKSGDGIGFGSSATALGAGANIIGYDTPGVTTATTYKGRIKSALGNAVDLSNNANIGQIYAIEVSA
jgi:hypothetical protein